MIDKDSKTSSCTRRPDWISENIALLMSPLFVILARITLSQRAFPAWQANEGRQETPSKQKNIPSTKEPLLERPPLHRQHRIAFRG